MAEPLIQYVEILIVQLRVIIERSITASNELVKLWSPFRWKFTVQNNNGQLLGNGLLNLFIKQVAINLNWIIYWHGICYVTACKGPTNWIINFSSLHQQNSCILRMVGKLRQSEGWRFGPGKDFCIHHHTLVLVIVSTVNYSAFEFFVADDTAKLGACAGAQLELSGWGMSTDLLKYFGGLFRQPKKKPRCMVPLLWFQSALGLWSRMRGHNRKLLNLCK